MIFFGLYLSLIFLSLGVGLYPGLKKLYPDSDPLLVVNNFLFYWFIGDLIFRFFFQKLPVMDVKPLLTLPIKKNKIINYVLGKSTLSFFNFLPLFAIVPFSAILLYKQYEVSVVLTWASILIIAILIINFLNFIIESKSAETELNFLPILIISSVLLGLDYFNLVSFSQLTGNAVNAITAAPYLISIPIAILVLIYSLNFKSLKQKLSLDEALKVKETAVNSSNLEWTKKFGSAAPFLQLDLRLIWRNKRTKSSVWMLVMGLLYGLIFYPNPSPTFSGEFFYIFIGIFITGIFLMNFGQFIPAWDSKYYKLLMSQNIKYKEYLKSKYVLMAASCIIMFVLSIPYVYFGWKILLVHFVAMIYNIGVNTYVLMYAGSYNRKAIELDKKAAFNYQGTGAVQWLVGIPLMLVPMLIFALLNWLVSFEVATATIAILGIIGIVLHNKTINLIVKKYKSAKHEMISAFDQSN
ncbi:hypothetical protein SAMN05444411_101208 [Lutibacter oricola]|uniref:ABC-2 type transport system permease protein n=2 Tax=Lutibacter oricola TaxID=762486 RepID=A0A1H2RD70_9FLAO|nr:hypothetical protein SAMN05444411_101208 [Lutibacter oricola]